MFLFSEVHKKTKLIHGYRSQDSACLLWGMSESGHGISGDAHLLFSMYDSEVFLSYKFMIRAFLYGCYFSSGGELKNYQYFWSL